MEETYPAGYETLRTALGTLANTLHRMDVEGVDHLPPPGTGALVCPNHDGYLDPFFLAAAIPHRHIRGMGQQKVLDMPVIGPFLRHMGAFPVPTSFGKSLDKQAAREAVATLAEHLSQGGLGVSFPEGIVKFWLDGDGLKRFRPGPVKAAALAGVPVIPTAIYGTRFAFTSLAFLKGTLPWGETISRSVYLPGYLPTKVMIHFGKPMPVDPAAATDHTVAVSESERLRKAVFALRQPLKRRYPGPYLP